MQLSRKCVDLVRFKKDFCFLWNFYGLLAFAGSFCVVVKDLLDLLVVLLIPPLYKLFLNALTHSVLFATVVSKLRNKLMQMLQSTIIHESSSLFGILCFQLELILALIFSSFLRKKRVNGSLGSLNKHFSACFLGL